MNKEQLHVVFSADDSYSQHLGVAICSLLANFNYDEYRLVINILDGGISDLNKNRLRSLLVGKEAEILFHLVDRSLFVDFPEVSHLKLPTYYRLTISKIIPESVKRVLYLDSDIVVSGDLSQLADIDILGKTVAVVEENNKSLSKFYLEHWGLKSYFNAGVLLIDLSKWKESNVEGRAREFIVNNKEKIRSADQDALNVVLESDYYQLENKYNLPAYSFSRINRKVKPVIVHYIGARKPWHYEYASAYKKYYWHYLKLTPWQNYNYPNRSYLKKIREEIKLLLSPLTFLYYFYLSVKKLYQRLRGKASVI